MLLNAYRRGCFFDAWSEYYHHEEWLAAFEECGLSIDFYTMRERKLDELFPWDFIDCGVTKQFLKQEWERAMAEEITPNCKQKCNACGAARYGCGICMEPKGGA